MLCQFGSDGCHGAFSTRKSLLHFFLNCVSYRSLSLKKSQLKFDVCNSYQCLLMIFLLKIFHSDRAILPYFISCAYSPLRCVHLPFCSKSCSDVHILLDIKNLIQRLKLKKEIKLIYIFLRYRNSTANSAKKQLLCLTFFITITVN